jgi:CRP-like cAMP-binding protein
VFSGLVLNFSRPFRPGDTISIDGTTEGQVVEMNWRATHVLTGKRDLAIVPNSTIAKARIVNLNFPSGIHGFEVTISLVCQPAMGTALIGAALLNAKSILTAPKPGIQVLSIDEGRAEYEVTAYVEGLAATTAARNELLDLVYRHAAASGIRLAAARGQPIVSHQRDTAPDLRGAAERALDIVPLFATLTSEERATLAKTLHQRIYDKGEQVLRKGAVLNSLFIIGRGVLSVRAGESDEIDVLRFGPGDHFGEIGMLTGVPAMANITALTSTVVYELAKADLAPILETRPEIAHELSLALAERQAAGRALTAASGLDGRDDAHGRLSNWFLERIHRLLELDESG